MAGRAAAAAGGGGKMTASSLLYQSGNVSSSPFVLTGPVIGLVTATTARILVETNIATSVTLTLTAAPASAGLAPVRATQQFAKRLPGVFEVSGLAPETYYRVSFDIPTPGLVKAGFMTMPSRWSLMEVPARLAFVAGNSFAVGRDRVEEASNLWKSLFKLSHKGQIDYLIHMGNNVCLDEGGATAPGAAGGGGGGESRWKRALRDIQQLSPAEWSARYETICESFRGAYREAWNDPMVKHTLATVPNLMILNDREICADWGALPAHSDGYSAEFFVACCAYEVYNEYQRALFASDYEPQRKPYASSTAVDQAYHFHVLGDLGIMMLDVRAARTLHRIAGGEEAKDDSLPLLGPQQWKDIDFSLSDSGYFSNVRMLFVVTPTAPAVLGDGGTARRAAPCSAPPLSTAGHWFGELHAPEAAYLLSSLFDWRAKQPGHREVCILAGGMGAGFMTDICDTRYAKLRDSALDRMKQLVVAPICDAPALTPPVKRALAAAGAQSIAPSHQFKHYNVWKTGRQYAVIDVYLDYNESVPELGVVTKFTAQITGGANGTRTVLKPVDNTFRVRSNFANTGLFGLCDTAGSRGNRGLKPAADFEDVEERGGGEERAMRGAPSGGAGALPPTAQSLAWPAAAPAAGAPLTASTLAPSSPALRGTHTADTRSLSEYTSSYYSSTAGSTGRTSLTPSSSAGGPQGSYGRHRRDSAARDRQSRRRGVCGCGGAARDEPPPTEDTLTTGGGGADDFDGTKHTLSVEA